MDVFDKRRSFPFEVIRYPHMESVIPSNIPYGVFVELLFTRYRICNRLGVIHCSCNRRRVDTFQERLQGTETEETLSRLPGQTTTTTMAHFNCKNLQAVLSTVQEWTGELSSRNAVKSPSLRTVLTSIFFISLWGVSLASLHCHLFCALMRPSGHGSKPVCTAHSFSIFLSWSCSNTQLRRCQLKPPQGRADMPRSLISDTGLQIVGAWIL